MTNMLRTKRGEAGFTLVELLIVVAILGILAGVVVFSVAGVQNNSQTSACKAEAATVKTAQEAYFVKVKAYGSTAQLTSAPNKLLGSTPTLVTISDPSATGYTLAWAGACTTAPDLTTTP